jgi:hypothetical protein
LGRSYDEDIAFNFLPDLDLEEFSPQVFSAALHTHADKLAAGTDLSFVDLVCLGKWFLPSRARITVFSPAYSSKQYECVVKEASTDTPSIDIRIAHVWYGFFVPEGEGRQSGTLNHWMVVTPQRCAGPAWTDLEGRIVHCTWSQVCFEVELWGWE